MVISADNETAVEQATRFLTTLFAPTDLILLRPIETWIENGKKKSQVHFKRTRYRIADRDVIARSIPRLFEDSKTAFTNEFFGACPRLGDDGKFDLAWQIRTVRALWADIDNVGVEEALQRVAKAGLPRPSIVVNSGNGVHLYWLLDEPYLIDDVGTPPPVRIEWEKKPGGRNSPRKYIVEDGEKIYLDKRQHISRLSPKAHWIQNILAGIATAIGGDHTTDLSRLLRIPGSWNRKDERNGRQPVQCRLVECVATRKYGLAAFDPFQTPSPEAQRFEKIQAMPLPTVRRPTARRADRLAQLIAASSIAPVGTRSEADYALCCFAVENGIDKEDVWRDVEEIGKFKDQGRRYFDHTWNNAEFDHRAVVLDGILQSGSKTKQPPPTATIDDFESEPPEDASSFSQHPTIHVDPTTTPVGDTLRSVTDQLVAARNCYLRCEQLVVIHGEEISSVLSTPELQGLLNEHVEFFFVEEEGGKYTPLPPGYCNTWLNQRAERSRLPEIMLFTRNPVFTEDWRLTTPGFEAASGIYYAGPAVEGLPGNAHLDNLMQDFCFRSAADRTNYFGMLITALLIPRFIGAKPSVLFNGNQPGLGKSILAQIIAIIRDGHPTETISYNPNDEEFEKRLGAVVRRGSTTVIIDNAKGTGRRPRIESPCLERSITDPVLSYRLLGKSLEIRAENSHIFCITANSADISPDLVSRSNVINLEYEGDPKRRTFHVADPEGYATEHRLEILGELIGMVQRWIEAGKPMADVATRFNKRGWGNIVGGILELNGFTGFLTNAEEAAAQLDDTRREFMELVNVLAEHPQGIWTATELVELCRREGLLEHVLGDGSPKSVSTKFGTLAGRYVNERFAMSEERVAVFLREETRKTNVYRVAVTEKVPDLDPFAGPMADLTERPGTAR